MIEIGFKGDMLTGEINLPASKSISNRALTIRALSGLNFEIKNLSSARDTVVLIEALSSDREIIDVGAAGTAMRFLCACFALNNRECILTGSDRMKQRPINILVEALRDLGAQISYLENDGFPPLIIKAADLSSKTIKIKGNVSSQYISALMMISPLLPNGLQIEILPPVISQPYIDMTASIMKYYGVDVSIVENRITIPPKKYISNILTVEADWSAASYFYGLSAVCRNSELKLLGLSKQSWQGDSVLADVYELFGVETIFDHNHTILRKKKGSIKYFKYDFKDCPDLVPSVAVTCAALGIESELRGLDNLNLKESRRIEVLAKEIARLGVPIEAKLNSLIIHQGQMRNHFQPIPTHDDHRIAMAFATLAPVLNRLKIENESVVNKSYPGYWNDLSSLGFEIKNVPESAL